jgi:hypothetical protein
MDFLNRSEILQWQSSSAQPSFIWVTDNKRIDSSISTIALEMIDRLAKPCEGKAGDMELVLHSVYQAGKDTSPLPQNVRTATTMVKEAMYQTLSSASDLWLKYDLDQGSDPFQQPSLKQLFISLSQLFDLYTTTTITTTKSTESNTVTPIQIYWVIDRIDTAFWVTAKGLSDSPHRNNLSKSERLQVSTNSVPMENFLGLLKTFATGNKARKWVLKVLVTSHYDFEALNRAYGGRARDDEEDEQERLFDGKCRMEMSV